jgi:organic radical activating enzyme
MILLSNGRAYNGRSIKYRPKVVRNDNQVDFSITPPNLDTSILSIWSTEECNINCSYCYFKYFKSKIFGTKEISYDYDIDKIEKWLKAMKPDLIEFIGGEHSLAIKKIVEVDLLCTRIGAPKSLIIEMDTNGTLVENIKNILDATKYVEAVISFEPSDIDVWSRTVSTIEIYNNILYLHALYHDRIKVRFMFRKQQKASNEYFEKLMEKNIIIKEAYLVNDINKCDEPITLEDITSFVESPLGKFYYQAFNSIYAELYGYGRSCLDTHIRGEGWDRTLHTCYIHSIINEDTSSLFDYERGLLNIRKLEQQRIEIYKNTLKNPGPIMGGGCPCLSPYMITDEISTDESDCSKATYHTNSVIADASVLMTKMLRAKNLDTITGESFNRQRAMVLDLWRLVEPDQPSQETDPKVLTHIYTGSNPPSVRTIQRYFSFLGKDIKGILLANMPYVFDTSNTLLWTQEGSLVYVDHISFLEDYPDEEYVALHTLYSMTQILLVGTKQDIKKEIENGFVNTSPNIYKGILKKCISGK